MNIKYYISLFLFGLFFFPQLNFSQAYFNKTPNDDLGNISDKFQEHFYEALKQKGIENYDRAITSLLKCIELYDKEPVIYFELGRNYVKIKDFEAAEDALKKAVSKAPENEWYLDALYGVYYELNDFDNALKIVTQLVKFHPDYKEDLASLYIRNKDYKAALTILDELDTQLGHSKSRDQMRNKIYNATGNDSDRIKNLQKRIAINPDNESNYLNLIYRYSEKGNTKKAYQTAIKLLEKKPNSHLVHLALYKFYLDDNAPNKAIASMKIVLKSTKIKSDAKAKVLNDFVAFVRENSEYENELSEITMLISNDEEGKTSIELAHYYLQKRDKKQALKYYKSALEKENDNFNLIKNILLLHIDLEHYDAVIVLNKTALETYPAQPILYLTNGVAFNHLNRPKEAIATLETGIDYIIEDKQMEADFYTQFSMAYKLDNNIAKSLTFAKKAAQVLNKQ